MGKIHISDEARKKRDSPSKMDSLADFLAAELESQDEAKHDF